MRSLQPPDILLIHWRVYNSIANTRSFLSLLYTLIKLYYTKALSDQASSLALEWIPFLRRPRIPASFRGSAITFHLGGSSGILQDKVRMLGALVLCSPSEHIFCCTLLTLFIGEYRTPLLTLASGYSFYPLLMPMSEAFSFSFIV